MSGILYQEKYEKQEKFMHRDIHHGIIHKSSELKSTLDAQKQQNG